MDFDKGLMVALLREGKPALKVLADKGLGKNHLSPEILPAYDFFVKYVQEHGSVPEMEHVALMSGVALDGSLNGAAGFYADRILDRAVHNKLDDLMGKMRGAMNGNQPRDALTHIEVMLREMRKERMAGALVESLPALGPQVLEYYDRIAKGMTGIKTPWPTINEATLGFWPEDLALFVARMGVGKTWVSLMVAGSAWEQKIITEDGTERPCRVLYATTEMSKVRVAQRWFAIKFQFPYGDFRKAKLNQFQYDNFKKAVQDMLTAENFFIVGGDFDFSFEAFDAAIEEANPDIIVLDGAYLLKVPGANRMERAANAFDELKRLAKRRKKPIVVTMQFNREVKTNQPKTVAAESIAMTDVAGWTADLIYGLIQTEEMRASKRMVLKPLKVREGESDELELNWNFETMNFSELPKAAKPATGSGGGSGPTGGGDADDSFSYDSGTSSTSSDDGVEVPF